jgi:6-phospho-3-hexuloisomerase
MFGKANPYNISKNKSDWKVGKTIESIFMKKSSWLNIKKAGYPYYLISMCGIFNKDFLVKMWKKDNNKLPLSIKKFIFKIFGLLTKTKIISPYGHKVLFEKINNRIFFNKIRKYPIVTPFEMEKGPERFDVLPITIAYPKQELFACIDDNVNEVEYSMIERGLYKPNDFKVSHKENIKNILTEIGVVLSKIDENEVDDLVKNILSARKIIACGAGRVGMAVRGFVMRLKHLGLDAYILGDANVPALKQEDLFLVCSGSGETQTIFELTLIAQRNLANINLITGNRNSRMGKIAHKVVEIKAPSKTKKVDNFESIQPMTTLNEQCLSIFFDAVVLRLMHELNETHDTMWARHSNLE